MIVTLRPPKARSKRFFRFIAPQMRIFLDVQSKMNTFVSLLALAALAAAATATARTYQQKSL
jgi:hypothetical protein